MATYYFDTNGATAGFSTLTGAWDTSTALWSTSSAGTAATSAVTFTNADSANFGFAGTSATAGTATIANAVTVTLNQIVTANLADLQTIAATGTGALALAGTTPVINVGSDGGLTIAGQRNWHADRLRERNPCGWRNADYFQGDFGSCKLDRDLERRDERRADD